MNNEYKEKTVETGKKYYKMLIIKRLSIRRVICLCDCGKEKEVDLYNLKSGKLTSCGCHQQERRKELGKVRAYEMFESGKWQKGCSWNKGKGHKFGYIWHILKKRYFNKINNKKKKVSDDMTIKDLEILWDKQEGKCVYSKIELIIPTYKNLNDYPSYKYASVDRIDSNLPYQKGNIQFVSRNINYAKGAMSDTEFKEFLSIIIKNNSNGIVELIGKDGGDEAS